ncbi:pap2 superfamily protein, partial [Lasius niger]
TSSPGLSLASSQLLLRTGPRTRPSGIGASTTLACRRRWPLSTPPRAKIPTTRRRHLRGARDGARRGSGCLSSLTAREVVLSLAVRPVQYAAQKGVTVARSMERPRGAACQRVRLY